ncbi:baculoviral IAP repeat-containing protein 3-like isoform X1 [Dreissena polymorpha]|uniref:baculoviral IAP repeat-containing protein 3-like isoform X1 n=1 Tax=Dreissena polymorpha TaxID=45954 RepID=UPI002263D34E|nr:baculoviral IAP repeat-containing protein 3-like isoform X1 [Dreissena polymorpha]
MAHYSADVVANKQRQETPTPSTFGISTIKPKFPHYAQISKRFESFEEAANPWPKHSPVKIEDLVEAGLVYTGVGDSVRCYHCGGGLRNWEDGDSPMEEHAKWYPNCQHVLIAKGKQFIQQIGSGQRTETDGQIQNQRPAVHKKDPFEKDKIIIQTLKEFDFSEDQSKQAIQLFMLKNGGKTNYEAKDLMVILWEVAENPDMLNILNNHNDRTEECSEGMERMTVDDEPEDEADAMSSADIATLEEENKSLKHKTLCKICLDKRADIIFLPCGHMVSCPMCAPALACCPICRKGIMGLVKAYFATRSELVDCEDS